MNYQRNFSNQGQRQNPGTSNMVDEGRIKKVLAGDAIEMNEYALELAKYYVKGANKSEKLTTSQIRNFLNEIQKMKEFNTNKIQLLRPKLAYAAGRHKGRVRDFRDLMEKLIQHTNKENFEQFKNFVEAIVAYHRFHDDQ